MATLGDAAIRQFWEEAYAIAMSSKNVADNVVSKEPTKKIASNVEPIAITQSENLLQGIDNTPILGGAIGIQGSGLDLLQTKRITPDNVIPKLNGTSLVDRLLKTGKGLFMASVIAGGLSAAPKVAAPVLDNAANSVAMASAAKQLGDKLEAEEFNKLVYSMSFKDNLNSKLLDVYTNPANYSYNPKSEQLVKRAIEVADEKTRSLEERVASLEVLYKLNREDATKPIGLGLNLIKPSEGNVVVPRRGFNVVSTHAGLDEDGFNFATLAVETDTSKKLGFKQGQRLYSGDFATLIAKSPGYIKGLPVILEGCRLGLMNNPDKSLPSFTQEIADLLNTKVLASDSNTQFLKNVGGTVSAYNKPLLPVAAKSGKIVEVNPSEY